MQGTGESAAVGCGGRAFVGGLGWEEAVAEDSAKPLPPHEILEEVGRGAYLSVHRARDTTQDHIVALHGVLPAVLPPEQVGAFLREVRAAAQVRHPHVLPILAVGLFQGMACFTTKWTANGSLSERRDHFREPRTAAALIEKLAGATAAAHAHGLIHGGLQPSAVFFDEHDQPLVGGFGLAPFFFSLKAIWAGNPSYCARSCSPARPASGTRPWTYGRWE